MGVTAQGGWLRHPEVSAELRGATHLQDTLAMPSKIKGGQAWREDGAGLQSEHPLQGGRGPNHQGIDTDPSQP